jgi:hypothetical protein
MLLDAAKISENEEQWCLQTVAGNYGAYAEIRRNLRRLAVDGHARSLEAWAVKPAENKTSGTPPKPEHVSRSSGLGGSLNYPASAGALNYPPPATITPLPQDVMAAGVDEDEDEGYESAREGTQRDLFPSEDEKSTNVSDQDSDSGTISANIDEAMSKMGFEQQSSRIIEFSSNRRRQIP